jgi:hypothetical protein
MIRRVSFHGYETPTRNRPQWYVPWLVFQGGTSRIRIGSLTGGGQIYGHELGMPNPPVMTAYATPVASLVGGGQVVSNPPWLQALIGGQSGNGS